MVEDDFETLFIVLAHLMDLVLINEATSLISVVSQELIELALYEFNNITLFKPN
jgi:hypothetical protein